MISSSQTIKNSFKGNNGFISIFITLMFIFAIVIYYKLLDWFPWYWNYLVIEHKIYMIGSLFIVPFLFAAFYWNKWVTRSIYVLSIIIIIPRLQLLYINNLLQISFNIVLLILPLIIEIAIDAGIENRQKKINFLEKLNKERELITSELIRNQEQERRNFAQELHDDAIQESYLF